MLQYCYIYLFMWKKLVLPYFQLLSMYLASQSEQTEKSQSPGPDSNPGFRDTPSKFIIITSDHCCKQEGAHLLHSQDHSLYAETVIPEKYLL
jgi:hypothetical protein